VLSLHHFCVPSSVNGPRKKKKKQKTKKQKQKKTKQKKTKENKTKQNKTKQNKQNKQNKQTKQIRPKSLYPFRNSRKSFISVTFLISLHNPRVIIS
jgi:uncharacterized membrane protein YdbT with pleckstrin-like domain